MVAGATGLVGREVLAALLADRRTTSILALGRRRLSEQNPRLTSLEVDFAQLPQLPQLPHVDEAYIALGTTIKVAGSQQAFRAVDFDAVVAVAKAAKAAGATRLGVVSAMGADTKSRVFYSRVKGEAEQALASIGFTTLVIARPSLLVGDRDRLGQPTRAGERIGFVLSNLLKPLIPANYQAIQASGVARALVAAVREGRPGQRVLLSGEMLAG